jgi:hypothetical protein
MPEDGATKNHFKILCRANKQVIDTEDHGLLKPKFNNNAFNLEVISDRNYAQDPDICYLLLWCTYSMKGICWNECFSCMYCGRRICNSEIELLEAFVF